MLFWCAATSLRTWGVFTGQLVPASLTVKNELFCMACGDFVFLVLFLVATLSVGLTDGGAVGDPGRQGLYMVHMWRMYTVWFQTAIWCVEAAVLSLAEADSFMMQCVAVLRAGAGLRGLLQGAEKAAGCEPADRLGCSLRGDFYSP